MTSTQTTPTALSTVVVTPFGRHLTIWERHALAEAQEIADANGAPCGVWERGGWYTVCDVAPDLIEPDPTDLGWVLWAICDPELVTARSRKSAART